MSQFIIYTGRDEALVTTKKLEPDAIKEWFTDGGRDISNYIRTERCLGETAVMLTNRMSFVASTRQGRRA